MDSFQRIIMKFTFLFGILFFAMLYSLPGHAADKGVEVTQQVQQESRLEKLAVDKLEKYVNGFEDLTKQYAPEVVDAGLSVVRIGGLQNLVGGFVSGALAIFFLVILYKGVKAACSREYVPWEAAACIFGGLGSPIFGIFAAVSVFNVWNWVAIFEPKLYIAHRIFEKLL